MIVTYDQVRALRAVMRDQDAHEASITETGNRALAFILWTDDMEQPLIDGTVSVAGTVRTSVVA